MLQSKAGRWLTVFLLALAFSWLAGPVQAFDRDLSFTVEANDPDAGASIGWGFMDDYSGEVIATGDGESVDAVIPGADINDDAPFIVSVVLVADWDNYMFTGWLLNGEEIDPLGGSEFGDWSLYCGYSEKLGVYHTDKGYYIDIEVEAGAQLDDVHLVACFEPKGESQARPLSVKMAPGDEDKASPYLQKFQMNQDGGAVWRITVEIGSGYRLGGYSLNGGEQVELPLDAVNYHTIVYMHDTGEVFTDDDGNEHPITYSEYHYCASFDLTLSEDADVILYCAPIAFDIKFFGDYYTDLPGFVAIDFSVGSANYTPSDEPYWKYQTLLEGHNAWFWLALPIYGRLDKEMGDWLLPYTFRVYAGADTESEPIVDITDEVRGRSSLLGGYSSINFMIAEMPSTDKLTVELTWLDQTVVRTFDIDMPQDCQELEELKEYYFTTFGPDKFGKAAFSEEEKQSEGYARYCQYSQFRYYMRTVYIEQSRAVGIAAEEDRPAALERAKAALDAAARGEGADAVVWVFRRAADKGTTDLPIFTGVPTGSDNIAKTGINADNAKQAAMEAEYPANWTITNTWSVFGAFVTNVTAGGPEDTGCGAESTGYNSYGSWYYNGKFSEWGVSNYYVSDGDVMCWGNPDPEFTWNWAILRWQLGDEELEDVLADHDIEYLSTEFYELSADELEVFFPDIDFSRYGQLREVLPVETVTRLINAIGTVSPDSGPAIAAARAAYNELSEEEQALIRNYSSLVSAEAAFGALSQTADITYQTALANVLTRLQNGTALSVGSTYGEWAVLALARNGSIAADDDVGQAFTYLTNLGNLLDAKGPEGLAGKNYTTYSRIVLALSSLGVDASSFSTQQDDYKITAKLKEYEAVTDQGINGAAFALLALDSRPYFPLNSSLRNKYVKFILDSELDSGGWAFDGDTGDVDITAMVLQALAPYRDRQQVSAAVERGLAFLHDKQEPSGGFSSYGAYNAESIAQVIVALTELGMDPAGAEWKKGGLSPVDALLHFYDTNFGMFRHYLTDSVNQMATEQSAYALVAYNRFMNGKTPLYDMSDVFDGPGADPDVDAAADVAAAKSAVDGLGVQSVSMETANTEAGVRNYVRTLLSVMDLKNTTVSVEVASFTAALAGTEDNINGTPGSFACKVRISKSNGSDQASDEATVLGIINATAYVPQATDTITVNFSLLGAKKHDGNGTVQTLSGGNLVTWIAPTDVEVLIGSSVGDVFQLVLDEKGYTYKGLRDNYISSITTPGGLTLSEFTNGKRSGWMYTVNDTHPGYGLNDVIVNDGDVIVWHYTDDYTLEEGSEIFISPENLTVRPAATLSGGTASVSLTLDDLQAAIVSAETRGGTITIAPEIKGNATDYNIALSKEALSAVVKQTNADFAVQTPAGDILVPAAALSSLVAQAKGNEIVFSLEQKTASEVSGLDVDATDATIVELRIVSGGREITSFGGQRIKLTLALDTSYSIGQSYQVIIISADGSRETVYRTCVGSGNRRAVELELTHLSTFIVTHKTTLPFIDINGHWATAAIEYVWNNDLMNGVGGNRFAPDATLTRAMLVTILYRLDGEPAASGANPFSDVNYGQWYTDAVVWASKNGVVEGMGDGTFAPLSEITREQMAAMLMRYARYKGLDVSRANDLSGFSDAGDISDWAVPALQWANAEGLITGRTATTIVPQGYTTRAEAATILMRYIENVVK